jgi:hypothetical protein
MSSNYLAYVRDGRRYTGERVVGYIGAPTVSFSVGNYWDNHYRGRSFYRDRDRWDRRGGWDRHDRRDDWRDRGSRDRRGDWEDRRDRDRRAGWEDRRDGDRREDRRDDRDRGERREEQRPQADNGGQDSGRPVIRYQTDADNRFR